MQAVKALFDGQVIKLIEPVKTKKITEVLVIFPDDIEKIPPAEARKLLRGSGKGHKFTERLLESRLQDIQFEQRR